MAVTLRPGRFYETTTDSLVRYMVGRELSEQVFRERVASKDAQEALGVEGLTASGKFYDISFSRLVVVRLSGLAGLVRRRSNTEFTDTMLRRGGGGVGRSLSRWSDRLRSRPLWCGSPSACASRR